MHKNSTEFTTCLTFVKNTLYSKKGICFFEEGASITNCVKFREGIFLEKDVRRPIPKQLMHASYVRNKELWLGRQTLSSNGNYTTKKMYLMTIYIFSIKGTEDCERNTPMTRYFDFSSPGLHKFIYLFL